MDPKILILIFMPIVFAATLLGALLPLKIFAKKNASEEQIRRSERICSLCNCLAGGVFLATCFLALIPAARKKFADVFQESGYETNYPVCEAVVLAGFFLILLLEQTVTAIQQHRGPPQRHDSVPLNKITSGSDKKDGSSEKLLIEEEDDEDDLFASSKLKRISNSQNEGPANPRPTRSHHAHGHSHSGEGHSHFVSLDGGNLLHALILLLALSVHSIFEGMALGLQQDTHQIIYLLIAMVTHESLAAFALGASLLKNQVNLRAFIIYSVIFSSMIPLGAAIGIGIQAAPSFASEVCSAIMQAIAAGIFIFVTFFEILNHEFESGNDRPLKVGFAMLGYALLAVLEVFG